MFHCALRFVHAKAEKAASCSMQAAKVAAEAAVKGEPSASSVLPSEGYTSTGTALFTPQTKAKNEGMKETKLPKPSPKKALFPKWKGEPGQSTVLPRSYTSTGQALLRPKRKAKQEGVTEAKLPNPLPKVAVVPKVIV